MNASIADAPQARSHGRGTLVPESKNRLKISEIFHSIQGEAQFSGWPTVFVRLTGCPLRCRYCDTAYAFGGGEWLSIADVVERVAAHGARHVCVTGGEPLAQPRCDALLRALVDAGYEVCLETSGALDVTGVDPRVSRIVDIKTPGSGECERNLWRNVEVLGRRDALKLVICDRADYEWARSVVRSRGELRGADGELRTTVFLSPSYEQLSAPDLAGWILEDRLPVRLQVQLHKLLWGDVPGR